MAKQEKIIDYGDKILSWTVPEYEKHERSKFWYIIAATIAGLLLIFSVFNANFLFAVIIIITALITILHDGREPERVKVSLTDEGVIVGKKFYDYDEIKNFAILYKPRINVKNIYFEFKNSLKPRLSIPLKKENPLLIRKTLLQYLAEDLERTNPPLSESISKFLKI